MKYFLIIFLTFAQTLTKAQNNDGVFTVVIDAGHGGKDSGAVGYKKIKEKDITLNMAKAVKILINEYAKNVTVYLTRSDDRYISLKERTLISNYFKADLFISIHCDANKSHAASGPTIYLQKKLKSKKYSEENYKKSARFSLLLNDIFKEQLKMNVHKIMFNNYQVLRNTLEKSPSVLIETGYITNKTDAEYYKTKGQKTIAYAILKAIIKYKNTIKIY